MRINFKKGYAQHLASATAALLVAVGILAVPEASAQVAKTKHNLSTSFTAGEQGDRNNFLTGGNTNLTQICVFCHTPHGAASDKAPLWQRAVGPDGSGDVSLSATGYQTYSSVNASTTMDSPTRPIGSVSVACLSCHDGTQAINTMANYAGSGSKKWDDASIGGSFTNGTTDANGKFKAGEMVNLDKNLQNDHPIGIYYGGGLDATNAVSGTLDPAFRKIQSVPGGVNGTPVWYVEASGNSARDKKDIQLFTRGAAADGTGDATPYVECSSCHDPHMDEKLFLRVTAEGSAICLACHDK